MGTSTHGSMGRKFRLGLSMAALIHIACVAAAQTSLHKAAYAGHQAAVESLLDAGTNWDAEDKYGITPQQAAEMHGHEAIVQRLNHRDIGLK